MVGIERLREEWVKRSTTRRHVSRKASSPSATPDDPKDMETNRGKTGKSDKAGKKYKKEKNDTKKNKKDKHRGRSSKGKKRRSSSSTSSTSSSSEDSAAKRKRQKEEARRQQAEAKAASAKQASDRKKEIRTAFSILAKLATAEPAHLMAKHKGLSKVPKWAQDQHNDVLAKLKAIYKNAKKVTEDETMTNVASMEEVKPIPFIVKRSRSLHSDFDRYCSWRA